MQCFFMVYLTAIGCIRRAIRQAYQVSDELHTAIEAGYDLLLGPELKDL